MKWVIFPVFLAQLNCISSQPLTNENVRESRQLNFEECCPCPSANSIKANNVLATNNIPSDCPCRAADSETASSIFKPTLKAVESFVSPFKNTEEPKPLLNPEVGLASSVLETLREATDQEYQEALARDVARRALQVDSDAEEMSVSASKDIFSPRNEEAFDVIPEASHNEETRCIHPTLSRINELGHFEMHPQRYLLKNFLHSKSVDLHKNIFDMNNSPSDIQENILPAKNNLLDDIKIKSNLLKSKLFPNNKGLLQRMITDKSLDKIYYNKLEKKLPDWKLVAPVDNLKSSKLFEFNSSPRLAGKTDDFSLLKNNVQSTKKVVLTPLRKPQQSNKYVTDEALSSEAISFPVTKDVRTFKNTKDYDIDSKTDTSVLNPVLSLHDDCNLRKDNMLHVETTTENIDFTNIMDANTSNLPVFIPSHNSTKILDTIPSPSEIDVAENDLIDHSPHEGSIENLSELNIDPNSESITHNTYEDSNPTSVAKPTDVQETTNDLSIEENSEEADKYIPEIECTTENSKSEISSFIIVSTPEPITTNMDVFNFPNNKKEEEHVYSFNAEGNNRKEETSQAINNLLDKNKDNIKIIFPNIREGVIKTFENVKNLNEKLQEKIKLNVQDALQLVDVKNNIVMQEKPKQNLVFMDEMLDIPHESSAKKTSDTKLNTLSSHELQKMSDSILTLSSVNQNLDPNLSFTGKEISETLQKMDSSGEPSETIGCLTATGVHNSKKSEENSLNNNNKNIIISGSENQPYFGNLNTVMYKDIRDNYRKGEIPVEKPSLNIKELSSDNFGENEMAAQASEPKPQRNTKIGLDNSKYLKQDYVVQPDSELDDFGSSLVNVNNFFDNVKSTISNVFSNTNENIFRQIEDNEHKIGNNYKKYNQDRAFGVEKPKLNFIKSDNSLKAPEAIETDNYTIERYKTNLNPYKARVAVPKSFDVKPILTLDETVHKKSRTLNKPRNILPKTYSTNKFVYNSNEYLENENLRSLYRESEHNNPNSESTVLSPNIFQNNFRTSGSNLGSLKDRTEVSLQNIHKTIGNQLRAEPLKENNRYLNQNIGKENLFETMASKRNEWNEKLQAINLDLNDRLSSLSHRMTDSILPSLNSQPLAQKRLIAKSRPDVRNKQGLDYLRRINLPSDIRSVLPKNKLNAQLRQSNDNLSVPKLLKKSLLSDHLPDLKSPRLHDYSMPQRGTLVKPALTSPPIIKASKSLKPKFKDHKIISVTSTTRPKTITSGLKSPQTNRKVSSTIPKITAPSLEKNAFMSRFKSEPHSLGSENVLSRVLLDKKTGSDKLAIDVSSGESDQHFNFKNVESSKQETKNVALSKLREALKAKMSSHGSNKNDLKDNNLKSSANTDLEIIPSASVNVNKDIEGSLRQNVQYKCKMLCTKDK